MSGSETSCTQSGYEVYVRMYVVVGKGFPAQPILFGKHVIKLVQLATYV